MSKQNEDATTKSSIRCMEVMISREGLEKNAGLFWTLSVYSLENQPVAKPKAGSDSEVFHFMVFDWKRTIKELLDKHQVSYTIMEYFSPGSVLSGISRDRSKAGVCERDYLAAAAALHDGEAVITSSMFSQLPGVQQDDLIFEREPGY